MFAFIFFLCLNLQAKDPQPTEKTLQIPLGVFEQQFAFLVKDKNKAQDRERLIRAFVAGLVEQQEKLGAIDITDNRFVRIFSPDETNLLLGPLLRDPDDVVCWRALRALSLNGLAGRHFDTVTAMVKAAKGEQMNTVIMAMARSRDNRFHPHLREMLKHPDGLVRSNAAFEMPQTMPREMLEPVLAELWNDPHPQMRYNLTWYFSSDLAKLRERLKDPSPHVRGAALRIIGETKRVEGAKDAAALCNDSDATVRGQAAVALGLLKLPAHVDTLVKLLDDGDVYPRRTAVIALEQYQNAKLAPIFVKMLRDADNQVRKYSARALGKLPTPDQAKFVLALLNDDDISVRFTAAVTVIRWTGATHAKEIHRMVTALEPQRRAGYGGNGYDLIREMKTDAFLPTLVLLAENSLIRDAAVQQQRMIREKRNLPAPAPLP